MATGRVEPNSERSDATASSSMDTDQSSTEVASFLSKLRSPAPSDLSRKRKISSNPPKGMKEGKGSASSEPSNVSISDRVREFPGDHLCRNLGKLFCNACREPISVKKSVISLHIKSAKHERGKAHLARKEEREQNIAELLGNYDKATHPVGEEVRVYRVKVVTTFLKAGVPLSKLDTFLELLEENAAGFRTAPTYIPFIRQQEQASIQKEISGKNVSVIFDGTTHICEALAIILRFVGDQYQIQQRAVRVMLLGKSLTGEELAHQLIVCLSTELGIKPDLLVAAMRDRASVNSVAMRILSIVFPNVLDIGCFSHTLDHVGEKFKTPILDEFIKVWINMFSRSPKILWRTKTGLPAPTYSPTRWWSKWEVIKHLHDTFGDIPSFVEHENLPPSRLKLQQILNDPPKNRKLQVELAITVDVGEPFVKATYRLEGDGPLVLSAYEEIAELRVAISHQY